MKPINELTANEAISYYDHAGLRMLADEIKLANHKQDMQKIEWPWNRKPKLWEHPYTYGHIPRKAYADEIGLQNISDIKADPTLKKNRLSVSLDRLRIFEFPGKGMYNILVKFTVNNHILGKEELISFTQVFKVPESHIAPIPGYPLFNGITAGEHDIRLETQIINVFNDLDERILKTIDSPLFKNGLQLTATSNPTIPLVTEYAAAITESIGRRSRNIHLISPVLRLWFDNIAQRPKLAEGSYIAIQMPGPEQMNWNEYTYNIHSGALRKKTDPAKDLPYNYFVFTINRM